MNGPEFFMKYAGGRLLPADKATGDAVADADTVLSIALPQSTGKVLRLSSCWMVITPTWVATSFKAAPNTGFDTSAVKAVAFLSALKSGAPCMLLELGKRTLTARDLFVTYDPRRTCVCSQGKQKRYDATKEASWMS